MKNSILKSQAPVRSANDETVNVDDENSATVIGQEGASAPAPHGQFKMSIWASSNSPLTVRKSVVSDDDK